MGVQARRHDSLVNGSTGQPLSLNDRHLRLMGATRHDRPIHTRIGHAIPNIFGDANERDTALAADLREQALEDCAMCDQLQDEDEDATL